MSGGNEVNLAVFDVCNTLYSRNTTVAFLEYFHHTRGSPRFEWVRALVSSRKSPLFYACALCYKLMGLDLARALLVSTLRGYKKEEIQESSRDCVSEILQECKNRKVWEALESHREQGDRVILISNSLDIVIEAIAGDVGLEWVATELEFAGGRCTGRAPKQISGSKDEIVRRLCRESGRPAKVFVYTDNFSDRSLLRMADHPVVIVPHGKSDKRWQQDNVEFIKL